jgi:hypothetical protein
MEVTKGCQQGYSQLNPRGADYNQGPLPVDCAVYAELYDVGKNRGPRKDAAKDYLALNRGKIIDIVPKRQQL